MKKEAYSPVALEAGFWKLRYCIVRGAMSRTLTNLFTLLLALAGCAVTLVLTVKHFLPESDLLCGASPAGCKGVLQSAYAHAGPVPTALFGLGMYLFLVELSRRRGRALRAVGAADARAAAAYAHAAEEPSGAGDAQDASQRLRSTERRLSGLIWLVALMGCGISWWLQHKALYELESFCPWCFGSACLLTLILLLATYDYWIGGRSLSGEQKMLVGVTAFIGVLMGLVYAPQVLDQWNKIHQSKKTPTDVTRRIDRERIVRPGLHEKGNPSAKYLLVEFADYECPSCARAVQAVNDALKQRSDLRLGFRNMPLPNHPHAREAAQAAEAAAEQGKFWEMHDYLFAHQKEMDDPAFGTASFVGYARHLGLDPTRFQQDIAGKKVADRVAQDVQDGRAGGADTTPSFFLITPSRITRFAGVEELNRALSSPNADLWK